MSDNQKTLKSPVKFSGKGLHTGVFVNLTILPAAENTGYKFQRIDVEGQPIIEADVDNVVSTKRGTTLGKNDVLVNTTEHILAALYGLEIDNALIQLDGPEIPILDGSSRYFVQEILANGIVEQPAKKNYYILKDNLTFEDTEKNVEMLAVPSDEYRITVMVDYNSPLLGTQHASMYNIREFKDQIANCRTFVFLRELIQLVNYGLIKGGDADNAIVMVDTKLSDEEKSLLAKTFNREPSELQQIGIGILNNIKLNYENEPARHKLLDIVGDLALIGQPIIGHILAARPGHSTNVEFAKKIKEQIKKDKKNSGPNYDLNVESIVGIQRIKELLPHRYPFLLVDKIIEMSATHVVGVKNVTVNEEFFNGHFPTEPVMPGVLMVEAMAQTGGILVLKDVPDPENYSTYFMKIDKVKFKQKVIPGDSLVIKMEFIAPIRRGICQMQGTIYVRNKVVAEGELMAQIMRNK